MSSKSESIPKLYTELRSSPVFLAKLGNVLSVQPKKFDSKLFVPENPVMYEDEQGRNQIKGCDIENFIRWREEKGVKESNAKLVKWEDGSYTMFVGNEAFEVTITENHHTFSYVRHRGVYIKGKETVKKMMFKPCSIKHRMFIRNLENSLNPVKTTQVVSSLNNHEKIKKDMEEMGGQKIKALNKSESIKYEQKIDRNFLDDDYEDESEDQKSDFSSESNEDN
jgi:RNA polymerase-associated protein LEO1